MLQSEGRGCCKVPCVMWVFNEYELIKLATLNYNLIPSAVPLRFLAQDHVLPTFLPKVVRQKCSHC
jgi:hypothetical protein